MASENGTERLAACLCCWASLLKLAASTSAIPLGRCMQSNAEHERDCQGVQFLGASSAASQLQHPEQQ